MGADALVDWSRTPVGPVEGWPQSLRTALSILLETRLPHVHRVGTGVHAVLQRRLPAHPRLDEASGRDGHQHPRNVRGDLAHHRADVRRRDGGQSLATERLPAAARPARLRRGVLLHLPYSPIREESGGVGGVLVTVTETTGRVLGERRLTHAARPEPRAPRRRDRGARLRSAAASCGDERGDIPFALLYLLDSEEAADARRVAAWPGVGRPPGHARRRRDGSQRAGRRRRIAEGSHRCHRTMSRLAGVLAGSRPRAQPAQRAVVLPIAQPGGGRPAGAAWSASARGARFDDDYRGFFEPGRRPGRHRAGNARASTRSRAGRGAGRARPREDGVLHQRQPRVPHAADADARADRGRAATRRRPALPGASAGRRVYRNALRLLKLVNTLLDFSRIEAGRVAGVATSRRTSRRCTADLASALPLGDRARRPALEVDCPPLPRAGLRRSRHVGEDRPQPALERVQVHVRGRDRGRRCARGGEHVELAVRDTGIGIPPSELPRLFERFHRVEGARARTHEGTGIGLALVQRAGHACTAATMRRRAARRAAGTTFTVSHPARQRAPARRTGSAPRDARRRPRRRGRRSSRRRCAGCRRAGEPRGRAVGVPTRPRDRRRGARILVADDNADMRDYVRRLLEPALDRSRRSATARAALARRRRAPPDLVLTDVMMPELDGFGLLRALRADRATRARPGHHAVGARRRGGARRGPARPAPTTTWSSRSRRASCWRASQTQLRALGMRGGRRSRARASCASVFKQAPVAIAILRGPEPRLRARQPDATRRWSASSDVVGRPLREALPELARAGRDVRAARPRLRAPASRMSRDRGCRSRSSAATGRSEDMLLRFQLLPMRDADGARRR